MPERAEGERHVSRTPGDEADGEEAGGKGLARACVQCMHMCTWHACCMHIACVWHVHVHAHVHV